MPAPIEMSSCYFHQISSFYCFNVLCCINHWWHLPIAGDPVMTTSPQNAIYTNICLINIVFQMIELNIWFVKTSILLGHGGALVEAITLRDLGQVLYLQLPVRFGVKLRYSIRAVVGSASE